MSKHTLRKAALYSVLLCAGAGLYLFSPLNKAFQPAFALGYPDTAVSLTDDSQGVKLSWNSSSGESYQVYYRDTMEAFSPWTLVDTVAGTGGPVTWEDRGGPGRPSPMDPAVGKRYYMLQTSGLSLAGWDIVIPGIGDGAVMTLGGVEIYVEVLISTLGEDPHEIKQPGAVHYGNFIMRRNLVPDPSDMRGWLRNIIQGQQDFRDGTIVFLDNSGTAVYSLDFQSAWPARYAGPNLDSSQGSVSAQEEFELVLELVNFP